MSINLAPLPLTSPMVEKDGIVTRTWAWRFKDIWERLNQSAFSATAAITRTGQEDAIALTALLVVPAAVRYRVSYQIRVTQAATVSSSVQLTITSTEGAVVCTQSMAAYTGNAVDKPQSGMFIVKPDAAAPIQFAVAYASNGATPMQYSIDLACESL